MKPKAAKPYGDGIGSVELAASLAEGRPRTVYDVGGADGSTFSRTSFTIPETAKRWW